MIARTSPPPSTVTAELEIDVPLAQAFAWFAAAANLPSWTGFFLRVDPAGTDGHHRALSLVGMITTWIETTGEGERRDIDICSLIRGRTERARLTLDSCSTARTHVSFTVTVLHPESEAALEVQRARMEYELAAARRILELAA